MKHCVNAALFCGLLCGLLFVPGTVAYCATGGEKEMKDMEHHELPAAEWKGILGLSDEQILKLEAAHKVEVDALKLLREELKAGMDKLDAQVGEKAADADIEATLGRIMESKKKILAANEKFSTDIDAFLSPTQRAKKILHMRSRMRQAGEPRKKGGPGMKQREQKSEKKEKV